MVFSNVTQQILAYIEANFIEPIVLEYLKS